MSRRIYFAFLPSLTLAYQVAFSNPITTYQKMGEQFLLETENYFKRLEEFAQIQRLNSLEPKKIENDLALKAEWSLRLGEDRVPFSFQEMETLQRADLVSRLLLRKIQQLGDSIFFDLERSHQLMLKVESVFSGLKPKVRAEVLAQHDESKWIHVIHRTKGHLEKTSEDDFDSLEEETLRRFVLVKKAEKADKIDAAWEFLLSAIQSFDGELSPGFERALGEVVYKRMSKESKAINVWFEISQNMDLSIQQHVWALLIRKAYEQKNYQLLAKIQAKQQLFADQFSLVFSEEEALLLAEALVRQNLFLEAEKIYAETLQKTLDQRIKMEALIGSVDVLEASFKKKQPPGWISKDLTNYQSERLERYRAAMELAWSSEKRDAMLARYIAALIENAYLEDAAEYAEILKRSGVFDGGRMDGLSLKVWALRESLQADIQDKEKEVLFRQYLTELSQLSRVNKERVNIKKEKSVILKYRKELLMGKDKVVNAYAREILGNIPELEVKK